MLKKVTLAAAMVAMLFTVAWADCGGCEGGKEECSGGQCPITAAMNELPKMTYKVGDEETCCSASAAKLAEEANGHIHYVVSGEEFDSQADAMVKLADVTEAFVNGFVSPSTCSVSGTTTLAGHKLSCGETAKQVAASMKEAMDEIQMVYKVGDETCSCSVQAASLAKESGEKTQFVVGEESTCCSIDARIKMAHAKYKAAVAAFAEAHPHSHDEEAATTES